jgi:apoptosis-inducing factor 3
MEAASCLAKKAKSTVVIGMENVPFERVLGAKIGQQLQKLYENNGITFRLNQKPVKELLGNNGAVSGVVLDSGEQLPADIVILGAGVIPATEFLKDIPKGRDGSITVDEFLRVPEREGVYAAGDLARYPYFLTGESIRVEHYGMAMYQGALVAKNFMGESKSHTSVPFFWTVVLGKSLRYAGHATSYEDVIIDGDLTALAFTAFYIRGEQVVAVATMNRDPVAAAAAELLGSRLMPSTTELRRGSVDLLARLSK